MYDIWSHLQYNAIKCFKFQSDYYDSLEDASENRDLFSNEMGVKKVDQIDTKGSLMSGQHDPVLPVSEEEYSEEYDESEENPIRHRGKSEEYDYSTLEEDEGEDYDEYEHEEYGSHESYETHSPESLESLEDDFSEEYVDEGLNYEKEESSEEDFTVEKERFDFKPPAEQEGEEEEYSFEHYVDDYGIVTETDEFRRVTYVPRGPTTTPIPDCQEDLECKIGFVCDQEDGICIKHEVDSIESHEENHSAGNVQTNIKRPIDTRRPLRRERGGRARRRGRHRIGRGRGHRRRQRLGRGRPGRGAFSRRGQPGSQFSRTGGFGFGRHGRHGGRGRGPNFRHGPGRGRSRGRGRGRAHRRGKRQALDEDYNQYPNYPVIMQSQASLS